MTTDAAPRALTLFDLLARCWSLPAPVREAVFNADGSAVAFRGAGRIGIAALADPDRPEARIRRAADTGRQTIHPRTHPVRPLAEVAGVTGPVVPYGPKSFLTVTGDGDLVSLTPRGQMMPVIRLGGMVTALARDPASRAVAAASHDGITILPDDRAARPERLILPGGGVTALAYAPVGGMLAVGQAQEISLWQQGACLGRVALPGRPAQLLWAGDGHFLGVGLDRPGIALIRVSDATVTALPDYPTSSASLAFGHGIFATSGAFRIAAWTLGPRGLDRPVQVGRTGLVVVERVAMAPDRPLIAAGYASGLVCLAAIGGSDELMLRGDGGAVTALAYAADGRHLAMGDRAGAAALIALPEAIFK